ncbi:cysteine--tRNA ligase, partial [Candidatus Woesearchaeota archaeon]|nr:cysteine--tRNA ligase [Candidatus Woesearchaeota archaeon]
NGEKMSKSKGNFFTLRDLLKKKYDPLAIRYELLATHYRQQMDFREKDLESVKNTLKKFKELFITLENVKGQGHKKVTKLVEDVKYDFEASLDDDLNIAGALAAIYSFIREIHKISEQLSKEQAEEIKETLLKFNDVLGVMTVEKTDIPHEIKRLAEQRQKAREQKDWQKSDELRAIIKQKGYSIDDTKEGYIIKKI